MSDTQQTLSQWVLFTIAGFTLGGSYFVVQGITVSGQWWLLLPLLLFIGLALLLATRKVRRGAQAILATLFLLCTLIILSMPQHAAMLYVVICLLAIEILPRKTALGWVATCVVAVFFSELLLSAERIDLQDAFVNSLLTLFLSGFAFQRIEAEKGRSETRRLLYELEQKNHQLALHAIELDQQSRLEERQRLSRELHDTLGHKLTTSIVQLEVAERLSGQDPSRVAAIISTLRGLLSEGLEETRNIVQLLDQDATADKPLTELIATLVNNFEAATGLSVSIQIRCHDSQIPAPIKQHVFRIIQESLTNISRHAGASQASISLVQNGNLRLQVEDNGSQLDNHQGKPLPPIKSIESRVAELQGTLAFQREGALTKLLIKIPLGLAGEEHAH